MSQALVPPPSCVSGSQSQSQRQKKEQELVKPGSSHGQTPLPDPDKVGFPRPLISNIIWEELDDDSSEDEREVPEEWRSPICCLESTIHTAMAVYAEEEEIERKRREAHEEFNGRNDTCYVLEELSFLDRECRICLKLGHTLGECPYREYVPKGALHESLSRFQHLTTSISFTLSTMAEKALINPCTNICTTTRSSLWSKLPPELLGLILEKLALNVIDILRFKSVCTCWNHVAKSYIPLLPPTPCLMHLTDPDDHKEEDDYTDRCFFSFSEKKVYQKKKVFKGFHDGIRGCVGSSHGWLVILDMKAIPWLFNPISRSRIEFPLIPILDCYAPYFKTWHISFLIDKAVLSSDPSRNKNFVVVIIYGKGSGLAFCKHGDNTWTDLLGSVHRDSGYYRDIVFHSGQLFALCSGDSIEVWDFGDTCSYPTKTMDFPPFKESEGPAEGSVLLDAWLVESIDELLVVECYQQKGFRFYVYKLNFTGRKWEKVERLDGRALLLAKNQSGISLSMTEFSELEENSIYFIVEYSVYPEYSAIRVYNLENQVLTYKPYYRTPGYRRSLEKEVLTYKPYYKNPGYRCRYDSLPILIVPNPL